MEEGDILVLRKKSDVDRVLKDEFHPLLRASERSLEDLWDNPEDDVWNDASSDRESLAGTGWRRSRSA